MNSKDEIVREALRQTELQLETLNQIATSADSRAMAFTGFSGVMATVFLSSAPNMPVQEVSYGGALGVIIGGMVAAVSALPRGFYGYGHRFEYWRDHIDTNDTLSDAMKAQAKENDIRIDKNEQSLAFRSKWFRRGVELAMGSSLLAILIQFIALPFQ